MGPQEHFQEIKKLKKNFEDCDVLKFAFNFLKVLGQLRAPEAIAKFILFDCVMF